jgi:hypothetical protein
VVITYPSRIVLSTWLRGLGEVEDRIIRIYELEEDRGCRSLKARIHRIPQHPGHRAYRTPDNRPIQLLNEVAYKKEEKVAEA